MSDFQRVIQLYLDFASSTRKYVGQEYPSWSESLRSLRIRYWYETLRQHTVLNTAYQLEQHFEPESFVRNADGSIQHYKNKWIRYEQGRHLPQAALLKRVEEKVPARQGRFSIRYGRCWTLKTNRSCEKMLSYVS